MWSTTFILDGINYDQSFDSISLSHMTKSFKYADLVLKKHFYYYQFENMLNNLV